MHRMQAAARSALHHPHAAHASRATRQLQTLLHLLWFQLAQLAQQDSTWIRLLLPTIARAALRQPLVHNAYVELERIGTQLQLPARHATVTAPCVVRLHNAVLALLEPSLMPTTEENAQPLVLMPTASLHYHSPPAKLAQFCNTTTPRTLSA